MKPLVIGSGAAETAAPAPAPAGDSRLTGIVTLAVAAVLVAIVTVLQGIWTERWGEKNVAATLRADAEILERVFPEKFGDWEFEKELESDPKELERAGAVGHFCGQYRNVRTKTRVSAFVVCATPHDASGHTPDRCYPGAGFEIGESEHRQTVPLADGRSAETFNGTFRKQGQTLRVFWTYGIDGKWIAPQVARFELAGADAVYKLYAIIDETRIKSQSIPECVDFLGALLPALDRAVASAREAGASAGGQPDAGQAATSPSAGSG
jgi:hypothetical protein